MLIRISSYLLLLNFIYHYYSFFNWYLSDQQIQIEYAFYKGAIAFISALVFIIYIHVVFFPQKLLDSPRIPSFPPVIMLFSLNLGFGIGIYNLYVVQLYKLPDFLDYFRSFEIGFTIILLSFLLVYLSIGLFRYYKEDPNPTTTSSFLITDGIFKFIRNPMYLALILFQFGLGTALSFIHISMMSLITFILLHYFVVMREELYLKNKFGKSYESYLKISRRWI